MSSLDSGLKGIRNRAKERGYTVNFIGINHSNKSDKDVMKGCAELSQNATSILQISKIEGNPEYRTIKVERNRSSREGYEWAVQLMPKTETEELHYELKELETHTATTSQNATDNLPQDETYAKYCEIKALVDYYKGHGYQHFWDIIVRETNVTRQRFNNWKQKYGSDLSDAEPDSSAEVDD